MSVLLFMLIMTLLSLSTLENNLLEMKMLSATWHKQQLLAAGKLQLARIKQQITGRCMIKPQFNRTMLEQSLAQSSCTGNFQAFLYYYVIERLMVTANNNSYRITLLMVDSTKAKLMLQTTVAQRNRQTFRILL